MSWPYPSTPISKLNFPKSRPPPPPFNINTPQRLPPGSTVHNRKNFATHIFKNHPSFPKIPPGVPDTQFCKVRCCPPLNQKPLNKPFQAILVEERIAARTADFFYPTMASCKMSTHLQNQSYFHIRVHIFKFINSNSNSNSRSLD